MWKFHLIGNDFSRKNEAQPLQAVSSRSITSLQSFALKNASLYGELKKRKDDLEKFYKMTVDKELKLIKQSKEIESLKQELEKYNKKDN